MTARCSVTWDEGDRGPWIRQCWLAEGHEGGHTADEAKVAKALWRAEAEAKKWKAIAASRWVHQNGCCCERCFP